MYITGDNMKRIICVLLAFIMAMSIPCSVGAAVLFSTDFENNVTGLTLYGNAKTVFDKDKNSNVLYLDGSNGTYAEFPSGILNGVDTATVLFDIKPVSSSGNYFTFAIGTDNNKYSFFRIRGSEVRNAITVESYSQEREVKSSVDYREHWLSVALVYDNYSMKLYINGELRSENANTGVKLSDLGSNLSVWLGKSFYSGDSYYQGYFDNVKLYNTVLGDDEIKNSVSDAVPLLYSATVGSVIENAADSKGTDSHTAVYTNIDRNSNEITSYVKPSQKISETPLKLTLAFTDCKTYINGAETAVPCVLNLTGEKTLKITRAGKEETYVLKTPKIAKNPVLSGKYADPDIDILDGRFWVFPTTDGYPGWSGTQFHAFSSLDMVNWIDEGVILDVKEKTVKKNAQGVNIAVSKWSDANAWAPAIEAKDGKYYFYYCGRVASQYTSLYGEGKAIGVAYASSPNGPYTALDAPILYPKMLESANIGFSGQVIDPSVFTDDDGSSYLLFGNGSAAVVKLNKNMTSVDKSTFRLLTGLDGFRESVAVFKRNGIYYYTWSCDDTGSENYCVNWGYSKSIDGDIKSKGTFLSKNADIGILGTGHQSILYIPESDKCFIAYHRFYTPLSQVGSDFGCNRETCIDEVTFKKGLSTLIPDSINSVSPTYEGTGAFDIKGNSTAEKTPTHYKPKAPSPTPTKKITVKKPTIKKLTRGKKKFTLKWGKISGVTGYQIQYSTNKKFKKKVKGKKYVLKKVTVKKAKTTKKTVKSLKSKKKYYVRIRAYKKYKGETYYSKWSKTKSVKTK